MRDVNPYQSPLPFVPLRWQSPHSARSCPECEARVTLWASLIQPTPFWFKCPHCRARFRIDFPFKWTLIVTACLLVGLLTLATCAGIIYLGLSSLWYTAPIFLVAAAILELGGCRYITRRGSFLPLSNQTTEVTARRPIIADR